MKPIPTAETSDVGDPAGPRPARGERRAARTRAAILDAAERAFRADGYRGTRMEDLAEAADVAVGSIYGHFGSKDGLYHALAERSVELFGAYMDRAYAAGATPLERVMAAGDAYLRFHLEHPGAFRFLAMGEGDAGPVLDAELRERTGARTEALIERFREEIQSAIDAGEARPLDAHDLSRFLWGAWNGVIGLTLRGDRMALSDEAVAACIQTGRRLVLEGLVAPSARDAAGDALARLVSTEDVAPG
ncbi:unannotated protein [freshwater metagenome]|uniref:Unannotated protein n=1 Tax=freshwater metagenome TaxID=449393 RepID=A0A6J7KBJ2_9ZZZZ